MNQQIFIAEKKKYIKNCTLIIIAFSTAFFPRIINAIGAPSVINFLHFLVVPFALGIAIITTPAKERRQIVISWEIIVGCLLLLGVMLSSALLNNAGLINVFLNFVLLAEPFMLLLAIVCIPLPPASFKRLRTYLLASVVINLLTAFVQKYFLDVGIIKPTKYTREDTIQGVFFLSGAGNYVSCSVSLSVALYYLFYAKSSPIWVRLFWLIAAFYQVLISDSKQILLTFIVAGFLFLFTKFNNFGKALMYLIGFTIFMIIFIWSVQNLDIPGFAAIKYWANRSELYGPNGEAINTKMAGIRIVLSYYKSPLNWLFGIGPGHSIGRLGGWVFRDYETLLVPLGATIHPASLETWNKLNDSWLALESSLFVPMFSWAGIWGDLGFLGLGAYLFLVYIVWSRLALDDFSKFLLLTMFVYGLIITQMEEPGQSLTVAILIGLQWHEAQALKRSRYHPAHPINNADPRLEAYN